MRTCSKRKIKKLIIFFIIFKINSAISHTIFVIGPGESKNWHINLTKISNNLERQYQQMRESFEIFPNINIKNKQGISDYYNGNLDKLSDLLAEKIIQNFVSINFKSIEATKEKLKMKNNPDKEKTKNKVEREKISLISYGKGAFVLVNAIYKLKQKIENLINSDSGFRYYLEDIIAMDEISGYSKPVFHDIVQSQSIYNDMQNLAVYSDTEQSSNASSYESDSEYSISSNESYGNHENENDNIITIDLAEPLEKQLTYNQMLLLQGKIEKMSPVESQQLEILKILSQIKEGPEFKRSKSKIKLVIKIFAATGALTGTACATVVSIAEAASAIVGVVGAIIALTV